jgi:hypothetical protein
MEHIGLFQKEIGTAFIEAGRGKWKGSNRSEFYTSSCESQGDIPLAWVPASTFKMNFRSPESWHYVAVQAEFLGSEERAWLGMEREESP